MNEKKIHIGRSAFLVTLGFVSTLALLGTVKDTLAGAHYSQPSPSTPAVLTAEPTDPKLFEQIAFYPNEDVGRALVDLRIMKARVALVIPRGDSYKTEKQGSVASAERTTEFMLIIADRDFSIDAKQMQSTRSSPGILNLKDLTVRLLTEKSFVVDKRVVWFAPSDGGLVQWELKDEKASSADPKGRESWTQLFIANAGDQLTQIGRRT